MGILQIITLVIAICAVWIAYNQFCVNREKLKLDLFEKRFKVFSATRKALSFVLVEGNSNTKNLFEFRANTSEAIFLFEKDINDYLSEVDCKLLNLHTLHESIKPLPEGEDRSEKAKDITHLLKDLNDQLPLLGIKFSPYMKFKTSFIETQSIPTKNS